MKIDWMIDVACSPRTDAGAARYAALERFIARGEAFELAARDRDGCLKALFELPREGTLPAAALSLLGEGIDPGGDDWLRLEPVHLRADRSRLLLVPLLPDDIAPAEAQALQAALAPHLAEAGYELVADRAQRWYLRSPSALALRTLPPQSCAGALDEGHLPAGADGADLRRLITEAQMLLSALPVNEAREASGKLAVNGVWPWGNGCMSPLPRSRYARVFSDDPLVRGIAGASGAEAAALPSAAAGLATGARSAESLLVVCSAKESSLAEIERRWAAPLAHELRAGRIAEIRLVLLGNEATTARTVTRRSLRRWWRRARPLVHA